MTADRPRAEQALCILLVEEDAAKSEALAALLAAAANVEFAVDVARTADQAQIRLREEIYDAVLLPERIGGWSSIEMALLVDHDDPFVPPFLLVADADDHATDFAAQQAGMAEFLVRSELTVPLLERSIRYSLERKQNEQRLARLAYFDSLTGLPNRQAFRDDLDERIVDVGYMEGSFALLLLDLDHFKDVNDTLGHPVGDLLLQATAQRLTGTVGEKDFVARLGGDEFVVCTRSDLDREEIEALAREIVADLSAPFTLDGREIRTATSIGIAVFPDDGRTYPELLKHADQALYRAKDAGRGTHVFFAPEYAIT
ncbi:MAG TPA: GGDEF domain-containing protein [Candidatus Krumholzibacteria bacterium]|nr:GGDEF domain-containing protein [Candidatus Krumholzibacteria bacterium]HRX51931.1 GGDEF domain-containing protein [Candidatus Krumholzibacteria bacterium]